MEATAGLSEPQRIINTFVAPSKTFEDIRRNTSWWAPWVLISVFAVLFVFAVDRKIGFDRITETQIAKSTRASEQFEKMPPERRAAQLEMQTKVTRAISFGWPVLLLLTGVITAAVVMAIFNFGMGQTLKFATCMAIVFYSWLTGLVSSVLAIITVYIADPEGYDISKPVASNLGYFFENRFLSSMLSAFDVFAIWTVVLMAIGISKNSKVKMGTAFAVLFVAYFLMKLVGAGFGSIFS